MFAERDVGRAEIHAILSEWHELRRNLYAIVFDATDMQACAGCISFIDDEIALITDSYVQLRVPYASASDRAVMTLDDTGRSVTLTWRDGRNAFIVRRPEGADQQHDS